jgi:hypothetical protein
MLPRDSAFVRHLSGPAAYWDEQTELTALLYDAIERLTYYTLRVNGNEPDVPEPYPRPGQHPQVDEITLADFNNLIGG